MNIRPINSINYQPNRSIKNTQFRARIPINIDYTATKTMPESKLLKKFYKFLATSLMILAAVSCADNAAPSYRETSEYRTTKKYLDYYKSCYVVYNDYNRIDNTALDTIAKDNEEAFSRAVNKFKNKTAKTKDDTITFHNAMLDHEKTEKAISVLRQKRKEYDEQELLKKQQKEEKAEEEYKTARSDVETFMSTN